MGPYTYSNIIIIVFILITIAIASDEKSYALLLVGLTKWRSSEGGDVNLLGVFKYLQHILINDLWDENSIHSRTNYNNYISVWQHSCKPRRHIVTLFDETMSPWRPEMMYFISFFTLWMRMNVICISMHIISLQVSFNIVQSSLMQ